MSDAEVRFHRLDGMPADIGEEQTFSFRCPRRGRRCDERPIAITTEAIGSRIWDGNRAAATFAPLINCGGCGWHGYIINGRCKDVSGNDEPEPS